MLTPAARRAWWRREPLSLPFGDEVRRLVPFLDRGSTATVTAPAPARFVDAAIHHGVGAYAVEALKAGRVDLPAAEARRLDDATSRSMLHAAVLRHELGNIAPVLADACASPPLVIKGPALAEGFYPDRRLR